MAFPEDILAPGECVVRRFRPHWSMVVTAVWEAVVVSVIAFLLVTMVAKEIGSDGLIVVLALVWFGFVANIVGAALRWLFGVHVVTDHRVMRRWGLVRRRTVEVPLSTIDNIGVDEGLFGRLLRYGSITLRSTSGQIRWRSVPQVGKVRALLARLSQEEQERRSAP